MKSMWLPLVAIFFMTYFLQGQGGIAPRPPPGSATAPSVSVKQTYLGQFAEKLILANFCFSLPSLIKLTLSTANW